MKKILSILLLMSNLLLALSADIKFDMLKIKLAKELQSEQYKESLTTMQEIKNTGIKLPDSFIYFEAKSLFKSGKKAESYTKFESYIEHTGKTSRYYEKSIGYIIEAEKEYKKEETKKKVKEAKRKAREAKRKAKRRAREKARQKINQIDKAYGWITPTNNICRYYGGETKSSSSIIKCKANWENAKSICRASGGHLPSLIDLRKVINDCNWNNDFNSCPQSKNRYYDAYWSAQDELEDDSYGQVWKANIDEGYEKLTNQKYKNVVRCVEGVDVPLQRVKKIIPKIKKRSKNILYYNLKFLSIENYEDNTIGSEIGYKSSNGLGIELAMTYTISSLEEEESYNTNSLNLTFTIPIIKKAMDVILKGGYMMREEDKDFIYGAGVAFNFGKIALITEYQTSDNIAFSDVTSLGLMFKF